MKNKIPTFEEWLKIPDEEKWKLHLNWNVYAGEGSDIAKKVFEEFKKNYGHIPKLNIGGSVGIYHGGTWAIPVEHPFIFDNRKIPKIYLGVEVRGSTPVKDMPKEFQLKNVDKEYVWAAERYEKFVDRCMDEIRKELGNPMMTREEMLDALCHVGNFRAWKEQCKQWEKEGKIPSFKVE